MFTTPAREQIDVCGACLQEMVDTEQWRVAGARPRRHNVAVVDGHGTPRLLVDVREALGPYAGDPAEWARAVHDTRLRYGRLPRSAAYLLIGYPDQFFVWTADAVADEASAPSYSTRDAGVLSTFTDQGDGLAGAPARERVVAAWVRHMIQEPDGTSELTRWLRDAGLLESLRDGSVARQLAAV